MLIKPSIILAAAVLAAASLLSPFARADGTDPLMPTGTTFDPNPAAPNSPTNKVLVYGTDKDGTAVPMRTLRITNNTPNTVYPIMRDQNATVLADKAVGLYDPYDTPKREYRGYIGYQGTDKKYYFGLKRNQTILVNIPLVFWDAARMGIETGGGGQYLLNNQTKLPNPLRNDSNAARTIAKSEAGPGAITNGVVMWYRADTPTLAVAPADDTEDQLVEWTVRDHVYLSNPKITEQTKCTDATKCKIGKSQIPDNQLVTLINYDVSNVDSLYLPVAMEALDVWVVPQRAGEGEDANRNGWKPGSNPEPYGWTGSTKDDNFLQPLIRKFIANGTTAQPNALLGQYFGGKGWPYYNFPGVETDKKLMIKIPSGANIFPQSPILDVRSSYSDGVSWQDNKYMLSSGGTDPVFVNLGAEGVQDNDKSILTLSASEPQDKMDFVKKDFLVVAHPPEGNANPIKKGTTVLSVDYVKRQVTLSQAMIAPAVGCTFDFVRPIDDYAASGMIKLWYSWAQYYLTHWKDNTPGAPTASKQIAGSIKANTATLTFNEEHPELVEGMAVTGPGLDDAQTEVGVHQGDAVILKIASKTTVILSQVVKTASTNAPFTFSPPKPLLWTPTKAGDPGYPLIGDLQFSGEPAWHDPYAFSQQVYLIMASMNQISLKNNNNVCKFMQDVVGANMGFIFTQAAKDSDDGKMVSAMIRDMIKSVLRGVTDFTKYPDVVNNQGTHTSWYPDPSEPHGKQLFNVFNLDPFVWFVHVGLGFSGYGFSVDDDTADVGAGGASQLQVTVTGQQELKNTNPWTIQAPYGPVKNILLPYSGPQTVPDEGNTLYNAIASVSNDTPIEITTLGAHNLSNGATVRIDQVNPGTSAANGIFKIGNVTTKTFDLFNKDTGLPVPPNGTYISGGRWSYYPPHPYIDSGGGADLTKVFYRVTGDDALGTFQGTLVSVNGVDRNKTTGKKFRVWQRGLLDKGRLLLDADLTDAGGNPLPAKKYNFTFFGIATPGPVLQPTLHGRQQPPHP